jgi:hypothetical protein
MCSRSPGPIKLDQRTHLSPRCDLGAPRTGPGTVQAPLSSPMSCHPWSAPPNMNNAKADWETLAPQKSVRGVLVQRASSAIETPFAAAKRISRYLNSFLLSSDVSITLLVQPSRLLRVTSCVGEGSDAVAITRQWPLPPAVVVQTSWERLKSKICAAGCCSPDRTGVR